MARGFSQVEGIDYTETFAPVIRYQSLRTLLAIANEEQMKVHQMDVKTAFLYGDLDTDIYMSPPEGCGIQPGMVCKLKRSLYGLKQSPRCWYQKLIDFLSSIGYISCFSDSAIYTKGEGDSRVIIGVYVDDLIILSKSLENIHSLKKSFTEKFKMQDFGEAAVILGIRITRDFEEGTLGLDQKKYAEKVLARFGMENSHGTEIPLSISTQFSKDQCPITSKEKEEMAKVPYRQAIGSLMYLMVSTRPDLAYPLQILSRYGNNPGMLHWKALKKVLQYLQQTKDHGLLYKRGKGVDLTAYCDADFSSCQDTSRSNGAYVFLLGGASISWSSKRQSVVAQSTCEAEYMAMNQTAREAIWATQLMEELGYTVKPVTIFSDSQSAIHLSKNTIIGPKSKHIRRQFHYVRESLEQEEIKVKYIPTESQIADALTKALPNEKLKNCREEMGVHKIC